MTHKLSRRNALILGAGTLAGVATGGTASARPVTERSAAAAGGWIRLPVITANIGRKHLGAREAAIRAVRNGDPGHRPIVGWQEIREGRVDTGEPAMIERHFGDAYRTAFLHHKSSYREPISVPQPWKIVNAKPTFVHGGIGGVTPSRWINELVIEHRSNPRLRFVLMNTHYIAGAYNGSQNPNLRDEWNLHKKIHRQRVLAHHKQGRLVIWTADTNRGDYQKATGLAAEHRAFFHGIDRIDWLAGDGTVQLDLVGTKDVPMHVDSHNARVAVFRIRLA